MYGLVLALSVGHPLRPNAATQRWMPGRARPGSRILAAHQTVRGHSEVQKRLSPFAKTLGDRRQEQTAAMARVARPQWRRPNRRRRRKAPRGLLQTGRLSTDTAKC